MKRVYLFVGITTENAEKVTDWIKNKELQHVAILVQSFTKLKSFDFGYPKYMELDLIPTSSDDEESIYKEVFHLKKQFIETFGIKFREVNIFGDIFNRVSVSVETILQINLAAAKLLQTYDTVIICLEHSSLYYFSILDEAIDRGLCEATDVPLTWSKEQGKFTCSPYFFPIVSEESKQYDKTTLYVLENSVLSGNKFGFSFLWKMKCRKPISNSSYRNTPIALISTVYQKYTQNFSLVMECLKNRLGKEPLVFGPNYLLPEAVKRNYKLFIPIEEIDYLNFYTFFKIFRSIHKLFKARIEINSFIQKELKKSKVFETTHFYYVLRRVINADQFLGFCVEEMKTITRLINLFKNVKPSCIYKDVSISIHDHKIKQIAEKMRIPVIASIHASFNEKYRSFGVGPTDYVTVIGRDQITPLIKKGYQEKQAILAGQPELDVAKVRWSYDKSLSYILECFPEFNPGKMTFLIASSCYDRKNEIEWIKYFISLIKDREDAQILIKPHIDAQDYYKQIQETETVFIGDHSHTLYPYFIVSDWVMTDVSHAGKLAIFFEKKLLVLNTSKQKFPFNNYDEEGVAHLISSHEDLKSIFEKCVSGTLRDLSDHYPEFIEKHLTSNDGKACERIVDLLLRNDLKCQTHIL